MTIAVAVSGGADSLYALASLREKGESCIALHALFLSPDLRPAGHAGMLERLARCCSELDIPFHLADLTTVFRTAVIEPFVRAYAKGETPNPCALCNAAIKFGSLLERARALGADRLATGHYARLGVADDGGVALYNGQDAGKDQSYFLSLVPRERLAAAVFPLGGLRKEDIRAWLRERGIAVPAPEESQEICFVSNDTYRAFVPRVAAEMALALSGPGPVRLRDGKEIGRHQGLWRYTEGQRKGLGIAWHHPLHVLEKDISANVLVVGGQYEMAEPSSFCCGVVNYLFPRSCWPDSVLVRTRYRQEAAPAVADNTGQPLCFRQTPAHGPYTAGQLATVYAMLPSGDLQVLAGGIIQRSV